MIGDDAHGNPAGVAVRVTARDVGDVLDERPEDIGVVVVVLVLQQAAQTLEAGARVDMLRRQRLQVTFRVAVELDEDEIADLDEFRPVLPEQILVLQAQIVAEVIVQFGARPAGTGLPHLPEVVLRRQPHHVVRRHIGDLGPQSFGVLVRRYALAPLEDGRPQALLVHAEVFGHQFPVPLDGLFLEIVAEGPVAEHLEERVMPRADADLFEVVVLAGDADALLRVHGSGVRPAAQPEEHVLELVHPGVGEVQGGVVRRGHGGAGHPRVALALEEGQEGLADLAGLHHSSPSNSDQAVSTAWRVVSGSNPRRASRPIMRRRAFIASRPA